MKRLCLLISVIVLPFVVQSQSDSSRLKKLSPFFTIDSYFSFIGGESADVFGFRAGITWNEKWRFGAGYNKITSDIVEKKALPPEEVQYADNDTMKAKLYFRFYPVMAEYIITRKDPWQISAPLLIGYGTSYFEYFDTEGNGRKIYEKGVLATQIGISTQYKVLKWFGLGAGVGYRLMLVNNKEIETNMNSPVFAIGIKIYLEEVWKSIRGLD